MTKLSALVREVFLDQAPLAAVGVPQAALSGVTTFATVAELPNEQRFAGVLWAGPADEAAAAALALRTAVNEGGIVLLLQLRGSGPMAAMRTWFGPSRCDEVVEKLCSALLCAGLARPALLVESAALTAAMGVRVQHAIV